MERYLTKMTPITSAAAPLAKLQKGCLGLFSYRNPCVAADKERVIWPSENPAVTR